MKKIFIIVALLSFFGCDKEIIEDLPQEKEVLKSENISAKKLYKVDVCHKGKLINISINAINAHQGHGDAVDLDGDGFFDKENDCEVAIDCDDTDANINPDSDEVCDNNIDDNCDGNIDECILYIQGLIAFYPFNGNANDESGFENHGEVNGASLTHDRYGNQSSAYNFDGLDDFIQIPSSQENILGNSDFTILTWFKTNQLDAGMVWNKRNTSSCSQAYGPTNGMRVGYSEGNKLKTWIRSTSYTEIYSINSVVDDKWHQASMVRQGNNYSLYIDGELIDTISINGGINFTTTLDLFIGKTTYCTGGHFKGDIDDFSIYNRALSSEEIIYLLNN